MTTNSTLLPENTNNLQTNKFTFVAPGMPYGTYFCQTVNFPGVNTSEVMVPTPFSETYRHGDKLQYDPLTITFLIDEDMRAWEESYNWLKGITFPHNGREYVQQRKKGIYIDCTLTINRNSNTPNLRVLFKNCHPTSLGPITFTATDDANMVPTADLTLRYDTFEFQRLNQG